MYPSIEQRIDLWLIFLVLPEMKARALAKALVAPYYMIISYAISLKYWSTLYSTVLREITMSLALALTISPG